VWRRLFSELLGTFFLVLVAAGGGMMGHAFPSTISRSAAVAALELDLGNAEEGRAEWANPDCVRSSARGVAIEEEPLPPLAPGPCS
jgi:hypothetical protein